MILFLINYLYKEFTPICIANKAIVNASTMYFIVIKYGAIKFGMKHPLH